MIRRDGWHRLASAEGPATVLGIDQDLVVWTADGATSVLPAACPHRGAPLADGRVEGACLVCPMHGWRWAADGANAGTGDGPALDGASTPALPVHAGVAGPLVWLSTRSPEVAAHDPVDLATRLPSGNDAVEVAWSFELDGLDPAIVIGNAFDPGHLPVVHGRARSVRGLDLAGDLARVEHVDDGGARARFTAYRSAQLAVELLSPDGVVGLGVLFTVDVAPTDRATVRYRAVGRGAATLLDRFVRRHRPELEADLALFRRQRPEAGRYWGPADGPLRDYEAWVASLA